ncbi:MAG: M48 family metalloprotease [Verrucomicrobiota bacterium]
MLLPFGLALYSIGFTGLIIGDAIRCAISRQMEIRADAAAVQYTRYPEGLAGALKKILGSRKNSQIRSIYAEEFSHLFFSSSISPYSPTALFETHPPLVERILKLDPHWNGFIPDPKRADLQDNMALLKEIHDELPEGKKRAMFEEPQTSTSETQTSHTLSTLAAAAVLSEASPHLHDQKISSHSFNLSDPSPFIKEEIGHVEFPHSYYEASLTTPFSNELKEAAHQTWGAQAIVFCLMFEESTLMKSAQKNYLESLVFKGLQDTIKDVLPLVNKVSENQIMALVDLCIPTLRRLDVSSYRAFRANMKKLEETNWRLDWFELALICMFQEHLDRHFKIYDNPSELGLTWDDIYADIHMLMSSMAFLAIPAAGGDAELRYTEASPHFQYVMDQLTPPSGGDTQLLNEVDCSAEHAKTSITKISQASSELKASAMQCCTCVAAANLQFTLPELSLLRALSDAWQVPIPEITRYHSAT